MTVSRKAAFSLLISVVLFAAVAVLAFTGLFNLIETRFYNTAQVKLFTQETESDAKLIESFFANLENSFSQSLSDSAVRRSFLPNQSAEDIFDRTRIYGTLLESFGGLQSIRFVDLNGSRIHFSTYAPDILNQTRTSVSYRNYNQDPENLPFETVQTAATDTFKLIMDDTSDRIIFSYPFFDALDVYRGTALFTLSVRAVAEQLISENKLKIGEDVSVTSAPPGIVTGSPGTSKTEILGKVSAIWNDGLLSMTSFESSTGKKLALLSSKVGQGFFYGRLVDESIFFFPQPMRIILLLSTFLTIFLAVFLCFNLKQDPMVIVQNRLKNLQISLIEQYYERKSEIDWEHWSRELEQRREEVRHEVKRGIKVTEEKQKDIDQLIDKSWNELLAAIGGNRKPGSLDEEKLQSILNRVLQTIPATSLAGRAPPQKVATVTQTPHEEEALVEELEDIDTVEEVETLDEVGDLNEVEELEEIESLEEVEPLEAVADADEVESLSEAESLNKVEVVEELEELDNTEGDGALDGVFEELEDIADAEAFQARKAFEEAEEIEELEEAEPVEGVDESAIAEEAAEKPAEEPHPSLEMEIDKVASHIEFDTATNTDGDDIEDILGTELEIYSPFASRAFFMSDGELQSKDEEPEAPPPAPAAKKSRGKATAKGATTAKRTTTPKGKGADSGTKKGTTTTKGKESGTGKKKPNEGLTETVQPGTGGLLSRSRMYEGTNGDEAPLIEIYNDSGSPIMYTPFVFEENTEPELLQSERTGLLASAGSFRDVIIERDGVNFISQEAFTPSEETKTTLDVNFKELVDSVIG